MNPPGVELDRSLGDDLSACPPYWMRGKDAMKQSDIAKSDETAILGG